MHERFKRKVWAFRKDFTAALAKHLVFQSPYPVPDNLEKILADFHKKVPYEFDEVGMAEVDLSTMTEKIYEVLESMADVVALNVSKNGRKNNLVISRFSKKPDPDEDFIDILALAQSITCEFADRADADEWLNYQERRNAS